MYWLDTTLLALLALGALVGAWCGFVWQMARILSIGLSVFGSMQFHEPAAEMFQECILQGADPRIVRPIAYGVVFIGIYLVLFYLMRLVRDAVRAAELVSFDRLLGAILGTAKMALFLGVICLGLVTYKNPTTDAILARSTVAPVLADGMEVVVHMVPEDYKTYLNSQVQNFRDFARTLQEKKGLSEPAEQKRPAQPSDSRPEKATKK